MSVTTGRYSFGWLVTTANQIIDFECATHAGSYQATLRLGPYTAGQFATEVARALNAAHQGGGDLFTCVYDFSTRKFTIDNGTRSLTLRFDLNTSTNAAGLLGFNDASTGSASGHTSTDTVGVTNSYFAAAGVKSWAPVDPAVTNTPITAQMDGSAALLLGRKARSIQQETDGGLRETIYFSTDKLFRIEYRYLSAAEQTNFDALVAWLEKGYPVDFRPDDTAASTVNCRFIMAPSEMRSSFSWQSLTNADYPALEFVEQLSRT